LLAFSRALVARLNGATAMSSAALAPDGVRVCKVVSSACWWLGGASLPLGNTTASTTPAACTWRSLAANGWAAIRYSPGDAGLPCATPDNTSTHGDWKPW